MKGFVLPPLADLFPFEYQGGGYFRKRGVPTGISADMLHGEQAVQFLYDEIKRQNAEHEARAIVSRAPCSCSHCLGKGYIHVAEHAWQTGPEAMEEPPTEPCPKCNGTEGRL